eukprot:4984354-Prymnesium_polylepis.1
MRPLVVSSGPLCMIVGMNGYVLTEVLTMVCGHSVRFRRFVERERLAPCVALSAYLRLRTGSRYRV